MRYTLIYIVLLCMCYAKDSSAQRKSCEQQPLLKRVLTESRIEEDDRMLYIPLAIHIVYANEEQNISNEQILSQIKSLNEDFSASNQNQSDVVDSFKELVSNSKLSFYLPSFNEHVIRTQTTHTPFLNADVHYDNRGGSNSLDPDGVINIWVVDLAGDLFGYNKTRDFFPKEEEGIVVDFRYFGSTGTAKAPYNLGRTLTHEMGHWLGLQHPWSAQPCVDGDGLSDTPLQEDAIYICNLESVSCGSLDMVQNFMNLAPDACLSFFTYDQKAEMRTTLLSTRTSLYQDTNPLSYTYEAESMLIYPNPAKQDFILVTDESVLSCDIIDTTGKHIGYDYDQLSAKKRLIHLKEPIAGVIFLVAQTNSGFMTKKVILNNYL